MSAATLSYSEVFSGLATSDEQDRWPARRVVEIPREVDASTSEYTGTSSIFAPHFARLDRISKDQSLWPSSADPPSGLAIDWARVVLQQLTGEKLAPARVVASAEGGIAICFIDGDKYADIECLNSGVILGVTSNRRDRPVAWEVEQSARSLARACERIRQFLHSPLPGKNVAARSWRRRGI